MRSRLLALVCGVIVLAGCGHPPAPSAAGPVVAGRGCPAGPVLFGLPAGSLAGIQFVSAARGWAVGQDVILATADGGRRWTVQRRGPLNLTSVDFIGARDGWAVGTDTVLATSDGGARWAALPEPEPCLPIRSVHFISPDTGFAVAGGRDIADVGPETAETGGVVLATSDGGRRWRVLPAPADAQTVCFSGPQAGWLGAGGRLYRTTDGGLSWAQVTAGPRASVGGYPAVMIVQCTGAGAAWALDVGMGATMSKQPNVGYHAGPAGAAPIFAEQWFPHPGVRVAADSPGAYPGPFSAISPLVAVYIGFCPACAGTATAPTAPWDLVTGSGAVLTPQGDIGGLTDPEAASFLSPQLGWVAGASSYSGDGRFRQCILFTDDAGRTWQVQYASPSP